MKRLALLLAAMGIVSAVAMAETPKLEVTHFNQEIEIENENGNQTFDDVWLFNNVGLKYNDWTFGIQAGKQWSVDLDGDSTHSDNARLQMDVWKPVTENLKLGTRLRFQDNYDRYYFNWDWSNGMFYSFGESWYEAANEGDNTDSINLESQVIGAKYGRFGVSYYLAYYGMMGSTSQGEKDYETEHQVRLFADLYKGEKLTLSTEARFTIADDVEMEGSNVAHREYDDFGRTRVYLRANYKVTESLDVYGYYAYEWRDWSYENGDSRDNYTASLGKDAKGAAAENYQDIGLGWTYKF